MLYQLTDHGRSVASSLGIDSGSPPRASLEHTFWARKVAQQFERDGFNVSYEQPVIGNGVVDVVAGRSDERVAIEIETGKSDITGNLAKLRGRGFDRVVLGATSPAAVSACRHAIARVGAYADVTVELMSWLDVS